MAQLNGRLVYTRADLQQRTGLSLSALEKLYRDRDTNAHPEVVGMLSRAKVWDAQAWDTWWHDHTDTTGLKTLEGLAVLVGRSLKTVRNAWADRDTNQHPMPRKRLEGISWFDPQEYVTWFTQTYLPSLATARSTYRRGHPDDLVTASHGSRSIGLDPSSTAKYKTRPPKGWPRPVPDAGQPLPSGGTRQMYRLGDFWTYADQAKAGGGRPPSTNNTPPKRWEYDGDPRLTIARAALATTGPEDHPGLSLRLATDHATDYPDTSPGTWSHILAAARKHPTD